ncbi:unnamed protein product [Mycena citricolor]|uniref:Uncharacterized protein n=1 Tax=Mycena citricolor TaxID=2018698 RepID=A0AAD2HZ69_9AGAR|nr:unnamed protein product [Mycena citricolor]
MAAFAAIYTASIFRCLGIPFAIPHSTTRRVPAVLAFVTWYGCRFPEQTSYRCRARVRAEGENHLCSCVSILHGQAVICGSADGTLYRSSQSHRVHMFR